MTHAIRIHELGRARGDDVGGGRRSGTGTGRGGHPPDGLRAQLHRRLLPHGALQGAVDAGDSRQRGCRRRRGGRGRGDQRRGRRPGRLLHEHRELRAAARDSLQAARQGARRYRRRAGSGDDAQGMYGAVPDPPHASRGGGGDCSLSRRGGRVRSHRLPVAQASRRDRHRNGWIPREGRACQGARMRPHHRVYAGELHRAGPGS